MKQVKSIFVKHADAPRVSTFINLDAWEIHKFDDLDRLVDHLDTALKDFWQRLNSQSVAGLTFPFREMIKYFWSKRPTSFTITFADGTKTTHAIPYPKDARTYPNIHGWA